MGANGPLDFSAKKLLIPTLKVWKLDKNPTPPPAYTVCQSTLLFTLAIIPYCHDHESNNVSFVRMDLQTGY